MKNIDVVINTYKLFFNEASLLGYFWLHFLSVETLTADVMMFVADIETDA